MLNKLIADLFHRMKYMKRRGSGLRKTVSETEKLPGYTEELRLEFHSSGTDFRVVIKNVNYNMVTGEHDSEHVGDHDTRFDALIEFCDTERSRGTPKPFKNRPNPPKLPLAFSSPICYNTSALRTGGGPATPWQERCDRFCRVGPG